MESLRPDDFARSLRFATQLQEIETRQDQQQHLDPSSSSSSLSTSTTSASASSKSTGKYTPGEKQALSLKAAHPGTLLMIEVGYKYMFYGEDARTAAEVLSIVAYPKQHFIQAVCLLWECRTAFPLCTINWDTSLSHLKMWRSHLFSCIY